VVVLFFLQFFFIFLIISNFFFIFVVFIKFFFVFRIVFYKNLKIKFYLEKYVGGEGATP